MSFSFPPFVFQKGFRYLRQPFLHINDCSILIKNQRIDLAGQNLFQVCHLVHPNMSDKDE